MRVLVVNAGSSSLKLSVLDEQRVVVSESVPSTGGHVDGQALLEHTVYDERSGQLLSGSLMDYALPRADDLPPLDITLAELPTAVNPLGVKGAGQAGCIAAPQTIVNAILDALSPLGIEHIDMPATPERVWRAIRSARHG